MRILSLAPLAGPGLVRLRALGEVELDPWSDHVPVRLHGADDLVARLTGVDALIVEADHVSRAVLERSQLRLLGVARGDPNNVDLAAATERGVTVVRTPARNAEAVADLALGLMLGLLRSIVAADDDVRAGRWLSDGRLPQQRYVGREIASCVVGLVGAGAVGRATARRVLALGARALAFDPGVAPEELRALGVEPVSSLRDLVASAEILSIHAPLDARTRGMIGDAELSAARPGALLVNTARYGIVDELALLGALRDGRLAGAALDHFENEILPPDHPLAQLPNVILTPHIGGTTVETVETHTRLIADGFEAVLRGERLPSVVNPETVPAG